MVRILYRQRHQRPLHKVGGAGLVRVHRQRSVSAVNVAGPIEEAPAFVRYGGQSNHVVQVVRCSFVDVDRAIAYLVYGEGEGVCLRGDGEGGGVVGDIVVAKHTRRAERTTDGVRAAFNGLTRHTAVDRRHGIRRQEAGK